ncbi:MAG TPA: cryptochrome/photolyase family protein [Cyclobacteriaceae bacterium]|mgnify:CR=1 FL=1|nr:cryptochrome/photolyase family protein [Cyclobacteriaceae bacterium]
MQACLVFPHQLYAQHPALDKSVSVYLIEDQLYFSQYAFHKQKLMLHRASMKYYESMLKEQGYSVYYIAHHEHKSLKDIFNLLKQQGLNSIRYCLTDDYLLERRIKRYANKYAVALKSFSSPNFINTAEELHETFAAERKYFMASFYIRQRKKLKLLTVDDKPLGGKWSFDAENRKTVPAGLNIPAMPAQNGNKFVQEARAYVEQYFPDNPGSTTFFMYPVTHEEANAWLDDFIAQKLQRFGDYEDAILQNEQVLFHSVLTAPLNIGLLNPLQIIQHVMQAHENNTIPLNNLEGFIRQVIGWREFMRGVYLREGVFERTHNYYGFNKKIPSSFYTGDTGIIPIDITIKKILATGYCHHIERLMVLGNFMHLCGFDPDEVYRWFMELFIDAYDWVMVPNVYGMSQYADGGLITTKPYVSGSNYILKMSDYKKGDWCATWDALYWAYIFRHKNKFKHNPRMRMIVNLAEKMDKQKLNQHLALARQYIDSL